MHHSLFDRFQGALFGSLLGEVVFNRQTDHNLPNWYAISNTLTHILLQRGSLLEAFRQQIDLSPNPLQNLDFGGGSDSAALSSIPIVLFFHDSLELLQQNLVTFSNLWQNSATVKDDLLVWGYGIGSILKEQLNVSNAITQLSQLPDLADNPVLSLWENLNSSLAGNTRLKQALRQLEKSHSRNLSGGGFANRLSLAAAFSLFLSTPTDIRLCVRLADSLDYYPAFTVALVGALAGAFGGYLGIPIAWRIALHKHTLSQHLEATTLQLLSVWAGVDSAQTSFSPQNVAIASPSVIQPRSTIPLISQSSVKSFFNIDI
jgi:ADP-ribosylglycohydrolase